MKILRVLVAFCLLLAQLPLPANISNQTARIGPFTASSLPATLSVTYPYQFPTDLLVLDLGQNGTGNDPPVVLTLNSDYTVTGGGYNSVNNMQTGSVIVNSGGANNVQANDQIVILRTPPVTQLTYFPAGGILTGAMIEKALDKGITVSQQLTEVSTRSLRFEAGEVVDGTLLRSARAGKFLAFDAAGNIAYSTGSGGGGGNTYTAGTGLSLLSNAFSVNPAQSLTDLTVTNTITGAISGNAATTTKLATARAINGVNFDGTAPVTVPAAAGTLTGTALASNVVASSLTSVGAGTIGTMAIQNANAVAVTGGSINGASVTGLPTPTVTSDAATKAYVDSISAGIVPRTGVVVATTANITLSGAQTIDGQAIVAGNRVLVKNQTSSKDNGIYDCAAGAWSRSSDSNTAGKLLFGYYYFVSSGTAQAATSWFIQTPPVVLGTDPVVFSQFSASQNYTAGTGLGLAGNVFSIATTQSGLTITSSIFNGTLGATTPSTIAGTTLNLSGAATGAAATFAGQLKFNYGIVTSPVGAYDSTTGGLYLGYGAGQSILRSIADNSATPAPISIQVGNGSEVGAFTTTGLSFSNAAILRSTKANLHLLINVKDYGATGDGGTNDTTAINNAAAAMTNYSTLYFPAGKYLTTGFATPTGVIGATVCGEGTSSVIYQTAVDNTTLMVERTATYITVRDLAFDGGATVRGHGVHIRFDASNSEIVNVETAHCSDFGFFIGQHNNATPTKNVRIANCFDYQSKGDGFHMDNVDGIQVIGCATVDAGDDAFAAVGYESASVQAKNISISGCRAYSTGGIGFRGLALLMVKGVTVSDFRAENMVGAGIEVGDNGNHAGVFNEDVVIRNSDMTNSVTSAGPYGAFNIYFTQRCTLENVTVRDPAAGASCIAVADFDDLQVSNCDVLVTRAGFARGIVMNPGATINGRTVRATWTNMNLANFHFNLKQSDNNEAIYLIPNSGSVVVNLLVTGAAGSQVPTGNYIATGYLSTAAKIGNNTCLQARTIGSNGFGLAATTFNNN